MLSDLLIRLRALIRPAAVERELDDELSFHFAAEIEKHVAAGLPRAEAARRARLEWGGLEQLKEDCREARGIAWLETCGQDIRYGLRTLRRSPTVSTISVLTLGFASAAVATVFTLGYALFLRELPVDRPDDLVVVSATREQGRGLGPVSYPDYVHFRDGATSLTGLAAHYSGAPFFATVGERSQEVNGAVVSANFFPLLGLRPALGRFFEPGEDEVRGRDRVAVIGFDFWRDWFGESPEALHSSLTINATTFTVIGVAPQAFRGLDPMPIGVYIPTMMLGTGYRFCKDPVGENGCTILNMIGRLRTGRTVEHVRAEVEALRPARWPRSEPGENTGVTAFRPRDARFYENYAAIFSQLRLINLLLSVAALLMFVCCANLTGLLLSRNAARTREFAIRAALGAGRLRLIRQLLTESALIAVAGGALGLMLSRAIVGALDASFYAMDMEGRARYFDFSLAPSVVSSVLAVAVLTAFLFGLLPALHAVRGAQRDSLTRRASPAVGRSRLVQWLVGAQAAIAVALVASAALMVSGGWTIVKGTYDASRIAIMRVRPLLVGYDLKRAQQLQRDIVLRLHATAGVESASAYSICGGAVSLPAWAEGQSIRAGCLEVGPRYFETLGIAVLEGREFDAGDAVGAPRVAMVDETLARRLFPGQSVVGQALRTTTGLRQIVGVVTRMMLSTRDEQPSPGIYLPFLQNPRHADARYVVRVKGDPAAMLPSLIREVGRVDPHVPVTETMKKSTQASLAASNIRMSGAVLGYAAILTMALTGIGLYGVLAFSVSSRTKEIGLRIALGAEARRVRRMVQQQGMRVIALGAAVGLGVAAASTRLIAHLLYGPPAADPAFYAGAGALVAVVGLFACWFPARRASRVEPFVALRSD